MAWTYSDWRQQATDADKLTRLRLHLQEVTDAITAEVAGGGMSKSTNSYRSLLDYLQGEERILEARAGGGPMASGINYVRVGGS